MQGANLLVVEDGPTNRKLISVILQEAGATVTLAENGLVGVELGQNGSFDAILMDMQMPVMDGYTATGKLREAGFTRPIIGLTAHAMAGDREKCLDAGCCGFLTKPIEAEKLIKYLASRLGSKENTQSVESTTPSNTKQEEEPAGLLHSSLPIDKPIYAEIVVEFSEYLVTMLDDLKSRLAAGDFDGLAEENDNFQWHVALSDPQPEDNWEGYTGFIHNVLFENYLKDHEAPEDCEFYMCGPPMMNAAVINMLKDLGVEDENILLDDFGG